MDIFRLSEQFVRGLNRLWNPWTDDKSSFEALFDSEEFVRGLNRLWNPWTDDKSSFEALFDKGIGLSFFSTCVYPQELSA